MPAERDPAGKSSTAPYGDHSGDLSSLGRWCRQGSGSMSVAPTPRLASLSHSLDEGSDNGKHADLDSPFDLSLAR